MKELQSFTKSTATKSAYQPPPAPPRDQEKDRQRAQQAFAAFCQRDKKPSEVEDEDPTSSTLPAQSEEQQATVQKEKKPVDQPKPES
uniref:RanBD1 domain-containing protein n=1 Tax=Steinernema glaseri TaxID=37863 RepID=A0A1I8AIT1_9BILA